MTCGVSDFSTHLVTGGVGLLRRQSVRTLQVNVGKLCNQACHHCHVDAGPKRTEIMARATAERVLSFLASNPVIEVLDLTGGAPELNPNFSFLVESARRLDRRVIVRCNLTVLFEPSMEWLPAFFESEGVEIVSSLPCYTAENVDLQRGVGVFDKSIEALRWLNRLGYGKPGGGLKLGLVYNPIGPSLPPDQQVLERRYRVELKHRFGIEFDHLLTITNMPIQRFAAQLRRWGRYEEYMGLLVNHFNPQTLGSLMCRSLLSVDWTGRLYDCDFNQMLALPLRHDGPEGRPATLWEVDRVDDLVGTTIAVGSHCFGCTAGAGSSCGGALDFAGHGDADGTVGSAPR